MFSMLNLLDIKYRIDALSSILQQMMCAPEQPGGSVMRLGFSAWHAGMIK
jgi:hypothetical protein